MNTFQFITLLLALAWGGVLLYTLLPEPKGKRPTRTLEVDEEDDDDLSAPMHDFCGNFRGPTGNLRWPEQM